MDAKDIGLDGRWHVRESGREEDHPFRHVFFELDLPFTCVFVPGGEAGQIWQLSTSVS